MTIPIGILASHVAEQDKLDRVKTASRNTGATNTLVTFDEATPLDNTHLIIAIAITTGNSTLSAYKGNSTSAGDALTQLATRDFGSPSVARMRVWGFRGDGTTNQFNFSHLNVRLRFTLLGFRGYSSLTPLATPTTSEVDSVTSATITPGSTPAGNGVALAILGGRSEITAFGTWDNGFMSNNTPPVDNPNVMPRLASARRLYNGGGSYGTTITWTTAADAGGISLLMPLA